MKKNHRGKSVYQSGNGRVCSGRQNRGADHFTPV